MFQSSLSINLHAFYHECRSLIGYATHYLFCAPLNKITVDSLRFRAVCAVDLNKVLNDWYIYVLKQLDYTLLISVRDRNPYLII